MHIALTHLRHAHAGGTERYCNDLAQALAARGHRVTIVCRTHEQAPHPAVDFVVLRDWALGRGHRLWRFARALDRHLADADYDVVYGLGRTWSQDAIRLGGGTWALYRERSAAADRPAWRRALGCDAISDRLILAIEARALGPVERGGTPTVVCNSELIAAEVQQRYGTAAERIAVIHNAVDCARFHPELRATAGAALRREWGIAEDETLLLFLGSNYRRKGLARVLAAFAAIADDHPEARLAVVGYDRHLPGWREELRRHGLIERVMLAGGRRDTERCYAAADCYLLPTRYDPFANTTLEALASGLPVITTDGNGGCEVLDEGCGSVVPWQASGDDAPLRQALLGWLRPGAISAARAACRARAEAHRLEVGLQRSIDLLERIAAGKAAS